LKCGVSPAPAASSSPGASQVEVELPIVAIKEDAKAWQHPVGDKADRTTAPSFLNNGKLYKEFSFDFTEFQKWLPRNTKVKDSYSIAATCSALERLFHLIDFPAGSDPKGDLC